MRWLVLVALVASVVAVPSTADAATSWWTPEERLGADEASIEEVHDVVLTHDGRLLLLYTLPQSIRVRVQSRAGTWGEPTRLFANSYPVHLEGAAVVTDDSTYVVWTDGGSTIHVSQLVGNDWVELQPIVADGSVTHVDAAVTPEGRVAVAWDEYRSPGSSIVLATATFDGATWTEPTSLEIDDSLREIRLEVADDGTRVLTMRGGGTTTSPLNGVYAFTLVGTDWSAPRRLSNGSDGVERANIASTRHGVVIALRERNHNENDTWNARLITFGNGSWSTKTLPRQTLDVGGPALTVGPDRRAQVAVAYEDSVQGPWGEVRTYRHLGGATWDGPEIAISVQGAHWFGDGLGLAIGPDGTSVVTAGIYHPELPGLVASVRGPGKPWPDAGLLGVGFDNIVEVHPVIDADGVVHLVWKSGRGWWSTSGIAIPFDDIQPGAFYTWPVLWAADVGLTTGVGGTDEFQPNRSITRAEAITTLWRLAGEQAAPPSGFEDAAPNAFYTRAVNWARHSGLTTGVGGSNRFEPNRTITRAELVTLLWRLDGSDGAPPAGFVDVAPTAFYARSVNWAKHTGITTGVGGSNRFEPNRDVTRAEAFTFVHRLASSTDVSAAGIASPSAIDEPPFGLRLQPAVPLD
ncbi:S-layer homology domain-containing protein [Actinomarinicola tropica]|nr:S-layer homology domain-containing protein [Actinomarinicola tropica]